MKDSFSINVSKLQKPTALAFDARPAAVKAWVEGLPMGHIGEATRQIYSALRETNGLELSSEHRFTLLEAVWGPVGAIVPALQRHYASHHFPIPEKGLKIAELSTDLQTEMVIGYRLALASATSGGLFARRAQKRLKTACLQRMLQLLRGVLFNYLVLNVPYPLGLWRELHRVYVDAGKAGWLKEAVVEPNSGRKVTLEQEYKHALLLALLATYLLKPEQGRLVADSLDFWASEASLVDASTAHKPDVAFCVALNMDVPPLGDNQRCEQLRQAGARCLWLDTTRVRNRIADYRKRVQGGSVTLPSGQTLTADSLEVLLGCWGEAPNRMEERHAADYEVEAAIGLSAIHHIMAPPAPEAADGGTTPKPETREPGVTESGGLALSDEMGIEKHDVQLRPGELTASSEENDSPWGFVFDQAYERKSWAEVVPHKAYSAVHGHVLDRSEHGYRICLPIDSIEQIRVGDLVGVRDGTACWRAGSIRWLRQVDNDQIQLGLQIHITEAAPVGLVVQARGSESKPIDSLLGLAGGGPVLVIPSLPGTENKSLAVTDGEVKARIQLGERIAGSSTFEAHGFVINRADYVEGGPERSGLLRQLAEPHLPKKRLKEENPPASDDQYGSLWSTL